MTKAKAADKPQHDYIAVVLIGSGSSHGRSSDKEKAITYCKRYLKDWESLFKLKGERLFMRIIDVIGYGAVQWDERGFHGKNETTGAWEEIARDPEVIEFVY